MPRVIMQVQILPRPTMLWAPIYNPHMVCREILHRQEGNRLVGAAHETSREGIVLWQLVATRPSTLIGRRWSVGNQQKKMHMMKKMVVCEFCGIPRAWLKPGSECAYSFHRCHHFILKKVQIKPIKISEQPLQTDPPPLGWKTKRLPR